MLCMGSDTQLMEPSDVVIDGKKLSRLKGASGVLPLIE